MDERLLLHWFGVRCVFRHRDQSAYEERVTLWAAATFDEAIGMAEREAVDYADQPGVDFVGLAQAYAFDGDPVSGAEVFSLIRRSALEPDRYVSRFFDTGSEIT